MSVYSPVTAVGVGPYSGSDITNPTTFGGANGGGKWSCPATAPLLQGIFPSFVNGSPYGYQNSWQMSCLPLPDGVTLNSSTWLTARNPGNVNNPFVCPSGTVATGIATAYVNNQPYDYQSFFSLSCASFKTGSSSYQTDSTKSVQGLRGETVPAATAACPSGYVANGVSFIVPTNQPYNYQESMQMFCVRAQPPACAGSELATPRCYTACKGGTDPCYNDLIAWCQIKASDGSYPNLTSSPDMCGCHMGETFYANYFTNLASAAPIFNTFPHFESCYFAACASGSSIKKTTDSSNKCSSVTNCVSIANINNNGVINGSTNVAQSAACGNSPPSTGTGLITPGPAPGPAPAGAANADSTLLVPTLPATLFGLSQIVYLSAAAGIVLLFIMLAIIIGLSSSNKTKRHAQKVKGATHTHTH
jgi:hypothetical protein